MKQIYRAGLFLLLITILIHINAYSWGSVSHRLINGKAVIHLPTQMNSFKTDSTYFVTHSTDADARRDNSDTSFFAERWRHFFDIDDYPDFNNLPRNLNTLIQLYGWERVKQNGINPWVTQWLVDSLANQLARQDLAAVRQTASDIGHYVADAHQPLHCTINYNGQLTGNNGIHSRYETTMINYYISQITIQPNTVQYIASPLDFAFEYTYHSNSLVDSILIADNYAKQVSGWNGIGTPPYSYYEALWDKTERLTKDQFQRASQALANLWYTAWVNAGLLPLTIYPKNLDFGNVHIEQSKIESVTITNPRPTPVTIYSASSSNVQFVISPTTAIVSPFSNQIFYIKFSPVDSGFQTGSIMFINDSPISPLVLPLIGNGTYYSISISLNSRWNLISIPLNVLDGLKNSLFPSSTSNAFTFDGTYIVHDTLKRGKGYWLKFPSNQSCILYGFQVHAETLDLKSGWNLIGSISNSISVSTITPIGTQIQSMVFDYENGYRPAEIIEPGKGYWIKVKQDGQLILNSEVSGKTVKQVSQPNLLEYFNAIIFTTPEEKKQTLYFGLRPTQNYTDIGFYEMPPMAPVGIFDVRFASQRMLEVIEEGKTQEFPIIMSSAEYPVTIGLEMKSNYLTAFLKVDDNEIPMHGNSNVEISDSRSQICLKVGNTVNFPSEFALEQNYPNPFNLTTVIRYQLPIESRVTLKIYNTLGQEVKTLLDEIKTAGYKSAEWNSTDNSGNLVTSSVYFYRIEVINVLEPSNSFIQTRRMLLVK